MRRDSIFLCILVVLMAVLFGFGSRLGMAAQRALTGPLPDPSEWARVETISSMVEGFGAVRQIRGAPAPEGQAAPVFSRYPFNLKNELLVARGEEQGVKVGDVALYEGAILGIVEKVFKDSALVQTIFDARFKAPVRVGDSAADALLVGGPQPRLTLIPQEAKIENSDPVYSAAAGMPYGVGIGSIENLHDAPESLFRDAVLRVPYNPAGLSEVVIVPKAEE